MAKTKKSGPAIFMYCVIALTLIIAAICFVLYYGDFSEGTAVLWTGIVAFTIMYHLWVRLIFGNINKLFNINYKQWWFRERAFEKGIYKALKVRKWKDKALTYNPELFSLKDRSLSDIANTMAKVEVDHWTNVLISLSTLLFAVIWGQFWLFFISAVAAILFDMQFIVIQRYNRPRVLKLLSRQKNMTDRR
ncbi:MAG: hypothetical protein IJP33_03860 [Firmicutes bacterium]|nr:hypothetical protein [Bacillota bacterium]